MIMRECIFANKISLLITNLLRFNYKIVIAGYII